MAYFRRHPDNECGTLNGCAHNVHPSEPSLPEQDRAESDERVCEAVKTPNWDLTTSSTENPRAMPITYLFVQGKIPRRESIF